jgi:hypothetical protein
MYRRLREQALKRERRRRQKIQRLLAEHASTLRPGAGGGAKAAAPALEPQADSGPRRPDARPSARAADAAPWSPPTMSGSDRVR